MSQIRKYFAGAIHINEIASFLNGYLSEAILFRYLLKISVFQRLLLGRIAISMPDGIKFFVNDKVTPSVSVDDHYVRAEYLRNHEYVPRKGWIILDIGAHVGLYSIWASRKVGERGFVVAFEPNPLSYRWLVSNIELNKVSNIKALPFALGDKLEKKTLYVAEKNVGVSSLIKNHVLHNPSGKDTIFSSHVVQVLTLDYLLEKSPRIIGKPLQLVDLAKIDVEGYEMNVLRGAKKVLEEGLIKRFIIEVHKDQVGTEDIVNYLSTYGYKVDTVVGFDSVKDIVYMRLATTD
uniref:FkbM family methyltransferase n=1 Tax=Thermofilum adornatum TaxID=1365176 RepID=A0A7C1G9D5_9CREN